MYGGARTSNNESIQSLSRNQKNTLRLERCSSSTTLKGKGGKLEVDNYRPISILSAVSKVFESQLASQINEFC